ncbi:MAG: toxic anion resistance protein [Solobacterium sp.]|nr:toxic anion resistance protein [Solobacterium sp.]MBR3343034.1 toxic anion resistance protein [Solobacterium sp.]HAE16545.1 toxic anion resistance protein [Erysipelotrichaceae bacterium]
MSENNNTQSQSITLTLSPEEAENQVAEQQAALEAAKTEQAVKDQYDESKLTEQERRTVNEFSKKIDIMETNTILQYGSAAQKKVTDFSDSALKNVRTQDLGEVGDLLSNLVTELKTTDQKEEKGIMGLFKKGGNKVEQLKARYDKAEANVDKIAAVLEDHQIVLLKDIALLDQLYERNAQNTKELSMYIIAGKKKLEEVRSTELPALVEKAKQSGLPEDSQAANDLSQACDRFEKKLYDLELTRQVSIQMAPQIRLIQNNDTLMTEKIQSTIVNTIPLWKNQIVLAMGINHSKEAMEAEREVTNMTNALLKKNAETLHQATVETAKEAERGVVDIETLQHTNQELIATLDEVLTIQKEGHEKRVAAEQELARIEAQLADKLLEVNYQMDVKNRK